MYIPNNNTPYILTKDGIKPVKIIKQEYNKQIGVVFIREYKIINEDKTEILL